MERMFKYQSVHPVKGKSNLLNAVEKIWPVVTSLLGC